MPLHAASSIIRHLHASMGRVFTLFRASLAAHPRHVVRSMIHSSLAGLAVLLFTEEGRGDRMSLVS